MKATSIEWTDFSANPLRYRDPKTGRTVWACVKHSPGCANCYAEALAVRYDKGRPFTAANMRELEVFLDRDEVKRILTARVVDMKRVSGARLFAFDMTDLFGDWVPDAIIDAVFAMAVARPDVTFQVLTKRAERMAEYTAALFRDIASVTVPRLRDAAGAFGFLDRFDAATRDNPANPHVFNTPVPNLWLGASVESQAAAARREPILNVRGNVLFLSVEPLIEAADLGRLLRPAGGKGVDWVIVGGESGPNARPCELQWIEDVVRQCDAAGVPVFVKQLGDRLARDLKCGAKKGNKMDEWPAHLRRRAYPPGTYPRPR